MSVESYLQLDSVDTWQCNLLFFFSHQILGSFINQLNCVSVGCHEQEQEDIAEYVCVCVCMGSNLISDDITYSLYVDVCVPMCVYVIVCMCVCVCSNLISDDITHSLCVDVCVPVCECMHVCLCVRVCAVT